MKYFSVAIVAAFLCAVVSAAPSSPNPTFDDVALGPIDKIGDKLKQILKNVVCARDVVTEVIGQSKLKGTWEKTRNELHTLATVELQKCKELKNRVEQRRCTAEVIHKGVTLISKFIENLTNENKELLKKIHDQVSEVCLHKEHEELATSIADQFQCIVDVLGDLSRSNGMEDLWSRSQPKIQQHLDNMKKCGNAGNRFRVIVCTIKEGVMTYKFLIEYLREVGTKDPKVLQQFMQAIQQRCSGQSEDDEIEFMLADDDDDDVDVFGSGQRDPSRRLKCVTDAINAGLKDSKIARVWEKTRLELVKSQQRMQDCKTEQTRQERVKCVRRELRHTREIMHRFLSKLRQENDETFQRIKDLIRQRCTRRPY